MRNPWMLASLAVALTATPLYAQCDSIVVTLLGTGTPNPRIERMGPSTLVEANGRRLLFDAGRGAVIRLEQAGVRTGTMTALFLTHLHSDHTSGVPDLWLTGWLPVFGGRDVPFRVIGPRGTEAFVRGLALAFAEDVRMRVAEERLPPAGGEITASEFDRDTTVFDEGGVRVDAFLVDHGGALRPAYGYRLNCGRRSVVLSGDTRFSENLVRHARGTDLLLHEVAMAPPAIAMQPAARFILAHHTSPEEAARVFASTSPRLAVFTHFAFPPNRTSEARVTASDVLAAARRHYRGRMIAGEDLMRVVVGDSVRVVRR